MLSIGRLGPGAQGYYLETVARGAEEYYTGAKEAPGEWMGASATRLGLDGLVDADALHRLLSHVDPASGERLTASRSVPKTVGFDATFCAPKSVSLLFALGDPETSQVRNAHHAAVSAAFGEYESLARGRRDHDGVRLVDGDGFVAAGFRHRTSRAGDPQLHTHVVVANLVYATSDNRWSALDGRPLYAWARPVGHLYQAQLRWELTSRLGVGWQPVVNGLSDIAGIPDTAIAAFSTRRAEITAHLEARSESGARAAQVATYATRQAKDRNLDATGLQEGWRAKATTVGLGDDTLAAALGGSRLVEAVDVEAMYRHLASPDGLTAHRSTFDRRHVIEAVCDRLLHGAPVADVLALVDGFLTSGHVIPLGSCDGSALRRGDGRLVPSGAETMRWTTPDMVATELHLLASAISRRDESAGVARDDTIDAAIAARPTLSAEQAAMVRSICASGAGVEIVEGVAGAGKTFALAAARDAWTASGYRVVGAPLAARAAARLEEGSGIPSTSLERLLTRLDQACLAARDVVVVDEAAMVGTRKLVELFDHAQRAGAKVVLIGDPRQLPEIAAGGAFAGLTARLGASNLTENRRQRESWERAALADLRAGRVDRAAAAYESHGRVHATGDVRAQVVDDWFAAYTGGEDVVMLAGRQRDVDDLNRQARHRLEAAGRRPGDATVINRQVFGVGDEVLALRNDYRLGLLNGTKLTIDRVDRRSHHFIAHDASSRRVAVPFTYAADGHLALGYAMTIHKAQGATVDRAFVLATPGFAAEPAYTALSRATTRTDLYIDSGAETPERPHARPAIGARGAQLETGLHRSLAQRLAVDQTDPRHGDPERRPDGPSIRRPELSPRRALAPVIERGIGLDL